MAHDPQKFSFAQGMNTNYLESLYKSYKDDPASVDETWQNFFRGYEMGAELKLGGGVSESADEAAVEAFVNAFRRLGHLHADLNPLYPKPEIGPDLQPEAHGLADVDHQKVFHPANLAGMSEGTFEEIHQLLADTYCGHIGADFREMNEIEMVTWLQEKMESCRNQPGFTSEMQKFILQKLAEAEGFEKFLQARFLGQKRFSVEGLDTLIPMLAIVAEDATKSGVEEIAMGMAHRGRLNVLVNFLGKNIGTLLKEFEQSEYNLFDIDGDVKYHQGYVNEIIVSGKKKLRAKLLPNPSHLEAVNPVVEGYVRARQRLMGDEQRKKIVPILIHGDAAIAGQGIVAETFNMARLPYYTTGGTIHIITNNQIGFTTEPSDYRSSTYSSEVAKAIRAPVLHVNADDPEAVAWSAQIAVAYRQKFGRDIVIDLIGYRRHGHNETDEPSFTQPAMYQIIESHPTVYAQYANQLVEKGVVTEADVKAQEKEVRKHLQGFLDAVRSGEFKKPEMNIPESMKADMHYEKLTHEDMMNPGKTAISKETLLSVGEKISKVPPKFNINPKLERLLTARADMLKDKGLIDWAMAELLAFGSLAVEGHHVRLSGQDCGRGTFSSRQANMRDYKTNEKYEILNHLSKDQASVNIIDSPLSEAGVVGFEFGYSVADRLSLVLWEAQFGDFANGAQIIFDQFMAASEAKWKQLSGLVLLLPHGHEGQGPEHSSGRPERFLQLCGNLNMQVAIPTTAAQYFHVLRRQIHRPKVHKPLILMTPKSLLRDQSVASPISDFTKGHFVEIIDDTIKDKSKVKRVVFCSGKVFYDLVKLRGEANKQDEVAIIRIEQLYPFPDVSFVDIWKAYAKSKAQIVWCQEEPQNMGAWMHVRHRFQKHLSVADVEYVGRKASGTTAEGSTKAHAEEQKRIIHTALGVSYSPPK